MAKAHVMFHQTDGDLLPGSYQLFNWPVRFFLMFIYIFSEQLSLRAGSAVFFQEESFLQKCSSRSEASLLSGGTRKLSRLVSFLKTSLFSRKGLKRTLHNYNFVTVYIHIFVFCLNHFFSLAFLYYFFKLRFLFLDV